MLHVSAVCFFSMLSMSTVWTDPSFFFYSFPVDRHLGCFLWISWKNGSGYLQAYFFWRHMFSFSRAFAQLYGKYMLYKKLPCSFKVGAPTLVSYRFVLSYPFLLRKLQLLCTSYRLPRTPFHLHLPLPGSGLERLRAPTAPRLLKLFTCSLFLLNWELLEDGECAVSLSPGHWVVLIL